MIHASYIYGAGPNGQRFYKRFKEHISFKAFIDSHPDKHGSTIEGLSILSPSVLEKGPNDKTMIFVVSQAWPEIANDLQSKGYEVGVHLFNGLDLLGGPPVLKRMDRDADFQALLKEVRPKTLLDPDRLYNLYQCARLQKNLPGAWAEAGVYKGGSALLLAKTAPDRPLYIFDSFEGMPEPKDGVDLHQAGDFADVILEDVKALFEDYPKLHLRPGFFPKTTEGIEDRFSLVHIDMDIYPSVYDACAYFWPRMLTGGMILFDDYGFPSCPGVAAAIHDYFNDSTPGFALASGQLLLTKIS